MERIHIQAMVKALRPVLKDRAKGEKILERYWTKRIALVWTTDDLHKAANERGLALTRKEAQQLLDHLKVHYNPQYGVKWTDLWDLIDCLAVGRKMTKQEMNAFLDEE